MTQMKMLRAPSPEPRAVDGVGGTFRSQRGAALAVAIGTALVASLAAYTVLFVVTNQARQSQAIRDRTQARYLAEAGLVLAMEKLLADPAYCPPAGGEFIDTNGNGTGTPDPRVIITVTPCGAGTTNHVITARATY